MMIVFTGTQKGVVLMVHVDKSTSTIVQKVWSAEDELLDATIDEDNPERNQVVIRRLSWLAPQQENGNDSCLFVLLGKEIGVTIHKKKYCYSSSLPLLQRTADLIMII